jgi:hypothetical protein
MKQLFELMKQQFMSGVRQEGLLSTIGWAILLIAFIAYLFLLPAFYILRLLLRDVLRWLTE